MATMKAVQVTKANGPFEVVERPIPEPGPGQVRIKVEACGICHSDAFVKSGAFPGLVMPRIPGHEIAGRVDAVGAQVRAWKKGDRAGVGWHGGHCFECNACRRGLFISCEKAQITGISYDGGYAEYAVVQASAVARIPESLDSADAGPLLCIGGLGHLAIQATRRSSRASWAHTSTSTRRRSQRPRGFRSLAARISSSLPLLTPRRSRARPTASRRGASC